MIQNISFLGVHACLESGRAVDEVNIVEKCCFGMIRFQYYCADDITNADACSNTNPLRFSVLLR